MKELNLLLDLASDARLAGVSVINVIKAIDDAAKGVTTVVKGDRYLFVNEKDWYVYDEHGVYYTLPNDKRFVVGNPCGYDKSMNRVVVRTSSIVIAPLRKALDWNIIETANIYPVR